MITYCWKCEADAGDYCGNCSACVACCACGSASFIPGVAQIDPEHEASNQSKGESGGMKKCKAEYFAEKYNPWASYTHTCEKADGHLGMHRDAAHGAWGFEKPKERNPCP